MVKIVQHSFLGGQLDYEMMGRQDVERYSKGASELVNFIPLKRGAIRKRPGTDLLYDVTARIGNGKFRLVPFAYLRSEGWAILVTEGAMHAVSRDARVEVEKDEDVDFFTGAQVEEFDYCQSGDVMFLAHIDHPPCKLEHRVENGVHSFRLVKFLANNQSEGIPRIADATVSKTGITQKGPVFVEYYRVASVFDGVETFHSDTYSNARRNDYDTGYDEYQAELKEKEKKGKIVNSEFQAKLKTYKGTAYTPPWTTSQKITLRIDVEKREIDGEMKYPEQLRIYRKTGSLYGLVGFVDTAELSSDVVITDMQNSNSDEIPEDIFMGGDAEAVPVYGWDADTYTLPAGTNTFTMQTVSKMLKITLFPGHLEAEFTDTLGWTWSDFSSKSAPVYNTTGGYWKYSSSTRANAAYVLDGNGEKVYDTSGDEPVLYVPTAAEEGLTLEFTISGKSVTATYGRKVNYTYTPCRTTSSFSLTVKHGSAAEKSVSIKGTSSVYSFSFASRRNEEYATLKERTREAAFTHLKDDKNVSDIVEINPAAGDSDTFTIKYTGGGMVFAGMTVEGIGNDESKSTIVWDDKYYTPDASHTPLKNITYMDGPGEWPACVCLSQQRLVWACTRNEPSRVLMSQIGDFEVYAPHDVLVDDDPIDFKVSATKFPKVNYIVELKKLLMFNGGAEWVVDSASSSSGITYATIQARQHSAIGSAAWLKPIICNNVMLFAEATGQAVRQYGYQLEDDGYGGDDISIFSSSIFRDRKIVSWAYAQHPHSTCWCVLSDGNLCSLTFMREQSTIAWATHSLGGGGKAKAVACSEALTGTEGRVADTSQVFLLVERDGRWTIEQMRCDCAHGSAPVSDAVCLDGARVLAAGDERREGTVAVDPEDGSVVDGAVEGAIEGYSFESRFTSVYPVVAEEVGMSQMDVKCVQEAHLRMCDAAGGSVRAACVPASQGCALAKTALDASGGRVTFRDTDENVPLTTGNCRDGRVTVEQSEPWPFTLLMIETDLVCEEDGKRRSE